MRLANAAAALAIVSSACGFWWTPQPAATPGQVPHRLAGTGIDVLRGYCTAHRPPLRSSTAVSLPGVLHVRMEARRFGKHWWKDVELVRQEFAAFTATHSLDPSTLPSTAILRTKPGGNHLIHVVQMYGGIANLSAALGVPSSSSAARSRRAVPRVTQGDDESGGLSGGTIEATRGATGRQRRTVGEGPSTRRRQRPFADSDRFREELQAFAEELTNNPRHKVAVCVLFVLCMLWLCWCTSGCFPRTTGSGNSLGR